MERIDAQRTSTKSKYELYSYVVPDIPDSSYAPATMNIRSIEAGIVKYFHKITHVDYANLLVDLIIQMKIPVCDNVLSEKIIRKFDSHFHLLDLYLEKPLSFENVKEIAVRSINGSLRSATSAGIGFKKDRKTIVREFEDDFKSCYDYDCFDINIYWKIFLKDELREKIKKTRSIAVGQLHMWIIAMKYLGGFYYWLIDTKPEWTGFGMDDRAETWTFAFSDWDPEQTTYGYDIKNQDSKMSPAFIDFMMLFLKRFTPQSAWDAIEWVLEQSFTNKKLVDYMGRVLSFSQGEMSGFPLTIVFNTLHNLFIHVQSEVVCELLGKDDPIKLKKVLGDDTLMQTNHPDILEKVALINGHLVTKEVGRLYEDVTFLSNKLTNNGNYIVPYYANLEKMYASLLYTTHGNDEYFQKCCSYTNLLLFSPEGSEEHKWLLSIYSHSKYLLKTGELTTAGTKSFKTLGQLRRLRLEYQ